jgi:5-methylcytosine-specific restriction endonuclease McrA
MQEQTPYAGSSGVRGNCVCKHCNKEYRPKHSTRITYCSRECYFEYRRQNPSESYIQVSTIYAGYCIGCGSPFVTRRKKLYCGDKCEARKVSVAPEVKQCRCCGESYQPQYTGGRPSEFCSQACVDLVEAAHKRIARAQRKAKLKAAWVERVDPLRVFDRDRWLCQLCGIKTPKSKRGTYEDDAPELDHIIPLSKGGEHSYRNTQCACRKCNGLKSDKPMGQMRLIG